MRKCVCRQQQSVNVQEVSPGSITHTASQQRYLRQCLHHPATSRSRQPTLSVFGNTHPVVARPPYWNQDVILCSGSTHSPRGMVCRPRRPQPAPPLAPPRLHRYMSLARTSLDLPETHLSSLIAFLGTPRPSYLVRSDRQWAVLDSCDTGLQGRGFVEKSGKRDRTQQTSVANPLAADHLTHPPAGLCCALLWLHREMGLRTVRCRTSSKQVRTFARCRDLC